MELRIDEGPEAGKRFAIKGGSVRLGRSSTADIQISEESLSRNHCLFEVSEDGRVTVIDLDSANGTYVNGASAVKRAITLVNGDVIEAGDVRLVVIDEKGEAAGSSADLGLTSTLDEESVTATADENRETQDKHNRLYLAFIAVIALLVVLAMVLLPDMNRAEETILEKTSKVLPLVEPPAPKLLKLDYEKIEADGERIFRYHLFYDKATGVFAATADDVPKANRHLSKRIQLSAAAMKRLEEIISADEIYKLGSVYSGQSVEAVNSLSLRHLAFVYGERKFDTLVENAELPDNFLRLTEALEAFSRNELGIWAIQFSGPQLIEMAQRSANEAGRKYDEREVEYRNLSDAVRLYKEALFYLETVEPKPPLHGEITAKRRQAEAELDARYREQRFLADKAINLRNWEEAKRELSVLMEIVPESDDPRHSEASAKLVDVEKRMRKEMGRGK